MNQINDKFPALWASFKEQVRAARTDREAIYTYGEGAATQSYGGRVSVGDPTEDINRNKYANLHISRNGWHGMISVNRADLVDIAAQCMAVAESMETVSATATAEIDMPQPYGFIKSDILTSSHLIAAKP
jgi:hypothetical protein